jgi:hypothetical protein
MPLYYSITVQCRFCRCPCPWAVVAEVEPHPDAKITIYCPSHGGPIPVQFRHFKRADELPPGTKAHPYPPPPPAPPPPKPHWWEFWKW